MSDKPKTLRRSQQWFNNPDNQEMTALYLERYLNYGLTREELQSGKPIIGIAQTGSDLSPCNRHHIELAKRSKNTMAVLMIDIDHFKNINDTHGHLCGDKVLMDLAKILKERSRAVNIAGRYGGEEFIIIGPISNHKSAGYLAERLRTTVEEHTFIFEELELKLTISIGVSVRTKTVKDATHMIKIADDALYEAKRTGRNKVVMGNAPKAPFPSVLSY